mmetsp:Transcript_27090/g.36520  ORF Transcript_27090/g.36520 Transcript_27090/m.36520 type:complete len:80 (-) Transcript_27090:51-290(-)
MGLMCGPPGGRRLGWLWLSLKLSGQHCKEVSLASAGKAPSRRGTGQAWRVAARRFGRLYGTTMAHAIFADSRLAYRICA